MLIGSSFDDQEFDTMKCFVRWLDEFNQLDRAAKIRVLRYLNSRYPDAPLVKHETWRKAHPHKGEEKNDE